MSMTYKDIIKKIKKFVSNNLKVIPLIISLSALTNFLLNPESYFTEIIIPVIFLNFHFISMFRAQVRRYNYPFNYLSNLIHLVFRFNVMLTTLRDKIGKTRNYIGGDITGNDKILSGLFAFLILFISLTFNSREYDIYNPIGILFSISEIYVGSMLSTFDGNARLMIMISSSVNCVLKIINSRYRRSKRYKIFHILRWINYVVIIIVWSSNTRNNSWIASSILVATTTVIDVFTYYDIITNDYVIEIYQSIIDDRISVIDSNESDKLQEFMELSKDNMKTVIDRLSTRRNSSIEQRALNWKLTNGRLNRTQKIMFLMRISIEELRDFSKNRYRPMYKYYLFRRELLEKYAFYAKYVCLPELMLHHHEAGDHINDLKVLNYIYRFKHMSHRGLKKQMDENNMTSPGRSESVGRFVELEPPPQLTKKIHTKSNSVYIAPDTSDGMMRVNSTSFDGEDIEFENDDVGLGIIGYDVKDEEWNDY